VENNRYLFEIIFEENLFFYFFLEWAGPGQKKKLSRDQPNKMQTIFYWAGLSPATWTGLMI